MLSSSHSCDDSGFLDSSGEVLETDHVLEFFMKLSNKDSYVAVYTFVQFKATILELCAYF